jgi:exodeoxyribonuclease V alpha subunit
VDGSAAETTIEGEVERMTFENVETGFRVMKVTVEGAVERLAVVGTFPSVPVGARVRVRGTIVQDKKFGEQLRAASVTELAPSTLVGVERYLGSGLIKGVGERTAQRIVAAFGMETLRVLDEEPERLAEVGGLGRKRIESIAHAWKEQRAIRDVMVFLQAHGASPALAHRIFKRYGSSAVRLVSEDPYRLALEVWGIGFKTADRIASELGIEKDSPRRLEAGVLQALEDAVVAGHTYVVAKDLIARAAELLDLEDGSEELCRAIDALRAGTHVVTENVHDAQIVYTAAMHAAEVRLGKRLAEIVEVQATALPGAAEAVRAFEERARVTLAPEQREAVETAARAELLVVTGGPGVGKTTIVRAILAVFDRARLHVKLAAPTGRAAARMSEATGREASTLHRLLEFDPKANAFKRDAKHPIEAGAIVVDESSMVDLPMADALLQAVARGTRLVLVGDVDQLASVGPGAVLRDVIASRAVPCVRLSRIFRQANASLIVENAHRINAGEPPEAPEPGADADFFIIARSDADSAQKTILELVTARIPRRFGLDPVRDVQVLTPMHRGPAGSVALNEALQAALNPRGSALTRGARTFRAGDKVMQLRNDYDRGVWNGDVGTIKSIDPEEETMLVGYDCREVTYDGAALDELSLAYACSIHKSQGSEYPAVVVTLLTSHYVMLSKNLLYTAITRGRRLVVLVSDPRAVALALASDRKDERKTRLAARIARARATLDLPC